MFVVICIKIPNENSLLVVGNHYEVWSDDYDYNWGKWFYRLNGYPAWYAEDCFERLDELRDRKIGELLDDM